MTTFSFSLKFYLFVSLFNINILKTVDSCGSKSHCSTLEESENSNPKKNDSTSNKKYIYATVGASIFACLSALGIYKFLESRKTTKPNENDSIDLDYNANPSNQHQHRKLFELDKDIVLKGSKNQNANPQEKEIIEKLLSQKEAYVQLDYKNINNVHVILLSGDIDGLTTSYTLSIEKFNQLFLENPDLQIRKGNDTSWFLVIEDDIEYLKNSRITTDSRLIIKKQRYKSNREYVKAEFIKNAGINIDPELLITRIQCGYDLEIDPTSRQIKLVSVIKEFDAYEPNSEDNSDNE